jgi:hypothetical protein
MISVVVLGYNCPSPIYRENHRMTDALSGIITRLGEQKAAIERALAALRGVDGLFMEQEGEPPVAATAPARKRRKFSAATRKKMALAQRARWSGVKGEIEAPPARTPEPVKTKRRISAEGMKRIIAATKKRWRLKRAAAKAALTKKAVAKKATVKKAVAKAPSAVMKVSRVRKAVVKKAAPAPAATPPVAQTAD